MSSPRYHQPETPEVMVCPFCGFHNPILYKIQFHIESFHTPDSPFIVEEEKAQVMELIEDGSSGYVLCTEETCGEPVLRQEFQTHLDMHLAERVALTDSGDERPRSSGRSHTRAVETSGNSKSLIRLRSTRSRSERSPAPTSSSSSSPKRKTRHSHSEIHTSSSSHSHHKEHSKTGEEQPRKKSKSKKLGVST